MKIGIDIRYLSCVNDMAGIYQYIYNLVLNLLAIDHHNDYMFLSTLRGFRGDDKIHSRFIKRFPGRLSDLLFETLSIPIEFLIGNMDIFHGPCHYALKCLRCKSIVTIHDIMVFKHPLFLWKDLVAPIKSNIMTSVKRSDAVIVVSNFTKGEVVELFHTSGEKIRVIYNGISPIFHPFKNKEEIVRVKAKYGVKGPYLLFVGNIEPKKNIEKLLHACVELRNSTVYKYPLLIVGKKAWYFKTVWEVVRQLHAENDTIFTDVIDGNDLPLLYNGAELFIFPSLFEGFGIPVIEAMACGTPVVASNRTSIPEISAGAALLFDPLNVDEMAGAMYNLLSNSSLRGQLVEKGFERAKYFSWEKTARETLKLYQEI